MYSLLKYNIFLVEPSLRMGDLNAEASDSSRPPISSSAHSISGARDHRGIRPLEMIGNENDNF